MECDRASILVPRAYRGRAGVQLECSVNAAYRGVMRDARPIPADIALDEREIITPVYRGPQRRCLRFCPVEPPDLRYPARPPLVLLSNARTVSFFRLMSPTEQRSPCGESTIKLRDIKKRDLEGATRRPCQQ